MGEEKTKSTPVPFEEVNKILQKLVGLPVLEVKVIYGSIIHIEIGKPHHIVSDYLSKKQGKTVEILRGQYSVSTMSFWKLNGPNNTMIDWTAPTKVLVNFFRSNKLGSIVNVNLLFKNRQFCLNFTTGFSLLIAEFDFGKKTGKHWFELSDVDYSFFYYWNSNCFLNEKAI